MTWRTAISRLFYYFIAIVGGAGAGVLSSLAMEKIVGRAPVLTQAALFFGVFFWLYVVMPRFQVWTEKKETDIDTQDKQDY